MHHQTHLVIGLGGLGRSAIQAIRRSTNFMGTGEQTGPKLDYFYIDHSDEVFRLEADWHAQSGDMPDDFLTTIRLDVASVIEQADQLSDDVRQWLSRNSGLDQGTNPNEHPPTPRRLASLMVTSRREDLVSAIRTYANSHEQTYMMHVVGNLAGGIGGGALLPVIMLAREAGIPANRLKIAAYGAVPIPSQHGADTKEQAGWALAGAALREVEGLSGQLLRMAQIGVNGSSLSHDSPCDEVYLFSPETESGSGLPGGADLADAISLLVRQRIEMGNNITPAVSRTTGMLAAAGSKTVKTGADEIEEALALAYLQSSLAQMVYAHWQHDRGFVSEARAQSFENYVRRPEVQNRWLLTAEHLIQSAPQTESETGTKRWQTLADEWTVVVNAYVEIVQNQDRSQWLDSLTQLCNQRFTQDFRSMGVGNFYRSRQMVKRDMARVIRKRIEQEFLEQWRSGERGLVDLLALLDSLIAFQQERLGSIDERIANIRHAEDSCRARVVGSFQEWSKLSSFGGIGSFGKKPKQLLEAHALHLHELHVNMTRAEGWNFARSYLPIIIEELEGLKQDLERLREVIAQGAQRVDTRLDDLSGQLEERDLADTLDYRMFDRNALRRFAVEMLIDERGQTAHSKQLRDELLAQFPLEGGFRAVLDWVQRQRWLNILLQSCRRDLREGTTGIKLDEASSFFRLSIYDQLQDRFGSDLNKLREFTAALIQETPAMLPINAAQPMAGRLYVLLPRENRKEQFIKTLKSAFWAPRGVDIRFVDAETDASQIRVMKVVGPFAASGIKALQQLDEHYRKVIDADPLENILSLHSFGSREQLARWLNNDEEVPDEMASAFILLGYTLGLLVEPNLTGGRNQRSVYLIPKDADGFDAEPIFIAEDLLSSATQISHEHINMLRDNVRIALGNNRLDRDATVSNIIEKLSQIRSRCDDNAADPVYRKFVEAGKVAAKLVKEGR